MIDCVKRNEIFSAFKHGLSNSEIARLADCSRTTVVGLRKLYDATLDDKENPEALQDLILTKPTYKPREKAIAEKQLQDLSDQYKAELKMLQDEFNRKYSDFQAMNLDNKTAGTIKERRMQELQENNDKIELFMKNTSEDLRNKEAELLDPIRKRIDDAIKIIGEEQGFMLIYDVNEPGVAFLGLLDIAIWVIVLNEVYAGEKTALITITTTMLTFGMGASTQALFARVGGGIYTKAADVGADLVGKVEANIPEDDPRNPATIADNVGDNVGDVAGMGADLYESYCGSILSTAALGATAFAMNGDMQLKAVIAPMIIAAIGIFLSLIGIFLVRTKEGATMKDLLRSLGLGTNVSAVLIAIATFAILYLLGIENWLGLSFSVISGLVAGVIIGQATEYYTSQSYKPTQKIAEASQTGPATVIIKGIGTGMISTMVPVVTISFAIMLSYLCANGFDMSLSAKSLSTGLYGIGIAAVGMLSTLGITLATDAYGPIADNAGGNAEMSGLGEAVRERTDALDALGNTTAATGKGFAIGSAALTALALLASYIEEIKIAMVRAFEGGKQYIDAAGNAFDPTQASTIDFINFFEVNLINPKVLVGAFLGAMAAFLFCGLTMGAVGRAAESMVQEVRRQFREIKGILEGKATPDYGRCVEISTRSAQREMIIPSFLAIVIPIVVGLVLGVAGVLGLLTGGLAAGFTLAVFMSNSGGAWDNAKKMIEEGNFGGKGSENHKATVVGDTVGDPFKDTSGPSLNILIKLMSMVSIVMAGLTIAFL